MCVCVRARAYVYMYTCTYVRMYVCVCVCVCACMYDTHDSYVSRTGRQVIRRTDGGGDQRKCDGKPTPDDVFAVSR